MARVASIQKQLRREKMVARRREQRSTLKKVIKSPNSTEEERIEAMDKLNSLPKNSSAVRLRNRCVVTGRVRGYYRKFSVSRLVLREMSHAGLIPGMTKASW